MEEQGIQYCEQPVAAWDFASLRKVSANTTIPIMADESLFDEHDAFRLLSMEACDYLNIKLAKSGGIHTALKINAIAEAAGVSCMMGCMSETRLGLTAAAHVVSARPNIRFADLDSADMLSADPVIGGFDLTGDRWNSDPPRYTRTWSRHRSGVLEGTGILCCRLIGVFGPVRLAGGEDRHLITLSGLSFPVAFAEHSAHSDKNQNHPAKTPSGDRLSKD